SEFVAAIPALRAECGDRAVLRALHFYKENARVPKQVAALRSGDFAAFLQLVKESGYSSWMYLQNVIPAGYKLHQDVALALNLCEMYLQGKGATVCMAAALPVQYKPLYPSSCWTLSAPASMPCWARAPVMCCPSARRVVWKSLLNDRNQASFLLIVLPS
ncbi:MAG: hypothetical protein IJ347_03310, partial [Faecalibacterium sp.]|nr:hypothetical protein [Faecalibacterium sp.]